ncbi:Lin0512 family protein [Ruegeria pomeroyi]|uniref:Lin0512 family protein n=1 Tax=Ruegeria pomeroyi TaxID=89184 RepID=A0A9Q3WIQ9_9RHOB|nr:Lin0512 family protein [Ruegeria pomeroyi]MCE8536590.1 Lin0512 family protein [Ruegeria pomeroyi]
MPKTQFAVQMGMGTDLKGQDYTKAAARAVHDALHRNFLTAGAAFDLPLDEMIVDIRVGVGRPETVDLEIVKAEAPVGRVSAEAVKGGLDVEMMGQTTLIANAIVTVSWDVDVAQ